ncbi:MAG: hypothetical protein B6242_14370 [Anaerolineaceae bacterium 4572_78]|nr:MAG: hypothetical protein B6242_14370 [Anaerolineaceae bacterium 4572_78]
MNELQHISKIPKNIRNHFIIRQLLEIISIFANAANRFNNLNSLDAAASLTFYALFSWFPLILSVLTISSFMLEGVESVEIEKIVLENLEYISPISIDLVRDNLGPVVDLRNSRNFASIIAFLGLLWSGTSFFTALVNHINLAWSNAPQPHFLRQRLDAFFLLMLILCMLILSLISTAVLKLLPAIIFTVCDTITFIETTTTCDTVANLYMTYSWQFSSNIVPLLFTHVMFLGLYRWVPNMHVDWVPVLWSAFVATIAWKIAIILFGWYLNMSLPSYQLIYGSLSTVVGIMFWIYINNIITLFGCHLSVAISESIRLKKQTH